MNQLHDTNMSVDPVLVNAVRAYIDRYYFREDEETGVFSTVNGVNEIQDEYCTCPEIKCCGTMPKDFEIDCFEYDDDWLYD